MINFRNKIEQIENPVRRKLALLIWALYVPLYIGAFFLVERLIPETVNYWSTYWFVDDYIPFREEFVIFYYLWYPALVAMGIFLLIKDEEEYVKYMQGIMITFTFTLVFCILVPNGQDLRPDTFPRDNIFTNMIGAIYAADTNTNVMPSVHALGAFLCLISTHRTKEISRRGLIIALDVMWFAIAMSTCFVKQHSIIDVIAAAAICLILYILYENQR
ncbi:phosphatase PAP2 family protein [Eubacteriales bacterium KG127]